MREARGFSLIELLVAGVVSTVVIGFAIVTIAQIQTATASQRKDIELASQGRVAMELMSRDVRAAGDAVQFLPYHCIGGFQSTGTPDGCAAVLDPHPWRITLARNAWTTPSGVTPGTSADTISSAPFTDDPGNVVTYQFVPRTVVQNGQGVLGHIERIRNPFGFAGQVPQTSILLDNVLLDERMKLAPDGADSDPTYDHALFLYHLLSATADEYIGAPGIVNRQTTTGNSFLLPPVRFFALPASLGDPLPAIVTIPPYLGGYDFEFMGLDGDNTISTSPLSATLGSVDLDMRYILDWNRIRAVRIAFKVVEPIEDPAYHHGLDLDPSEPGTARIFSIESTVEIKVFSNLL